MIGSSTCYKTTRTGWQFATVPQVVDEERTICKVLHTINLTPGYRKKHEFGAGGTTSKVGQRDSRARNELGVGMLILHIAVKDVKKCIFFWSMRNG